LNERLATGDGGSPKLILDLLKAGPGDALAAAGAGERVTYGQLQEQVDTYAKGLIAMGVERGDRVAMLTSPSVDFYRVMLATTSLGAIWLGVNPRYQSRDFEYLLSDARPILLIVNAPDAHRDYLGELSPHLGVGTRMVALVDDPRATTRRDLLAAGCAVVDSALAEARAKVDPEDPAIIVYTSGTTGKPKGAMLSHRAITSSALANAAWMGQDALARSICAAPVNHVGAINNICMNVMAAGGGVIFYPEVDIPALSKLSKIEKPTYLVSSPTGFAMMLSEPDGLGARLAAARLIVFGGATTALSTLEKIAPSGARLSSVYGQSETCGIITHTGDDDTLEAHAATIGRVLDGAELRITGPNGAAVGPGQSGEIQIRGPYVMSGYFNNPEATRDAFTEDGFMRTGDLGTVREDGNVVFVGRLKEMFKSGGYNVYPVEIEQAICEHPAVALAAVVVQHHETFQEVGFAFVQPEPGATVTGDELNAFLRSRIANYKIPKTFAVEEELPRLPNGKIDKVTLQARVRA
jgi:acyl-CoA synthetase (AMP-forming)/AMP-acid ligase II